MLRNLQNRVIGPSENVDYAGIINQTYNKSVIQSERFIGFKVLVQDTYAAGYNPAERIRQIDCTLPYILKGRGIIVRETSNLKMSDGYWIISMPVPISQMAKQLDNLMSIINYFEMKLGIVRTGIFEVNVSGRCGLHESEFLMKNLQIPNKYKNCLVDPCDSAFRYGTLDHLNDAYALVRTRWNLQQAAQLQDVYDDLMILGYNIAGSFR